MLPVLIAGGVTCLLIIAEPNMSVTMCVGMLMIAMLFLGGVKMKPKIAIDIGTSYTKIYKSKADVVLIETVSDSYEIKAAVLAAKENSDLPVVVTMIFDENGKLVGDCYNTKGRKDITPVPGGVGLLTRLALLENTVRACGTVV